MRMSFTSASRPHETIGWNSRVPTASATSTVAQMSLPTCKRLGERVADVERTHAVLAHDHRRLQRLGERKQLRFCAEHAAADEDRRVPRAGEQFRRLADGVGVRLWCWLGA